MNNVVQQYNKILNKLISNGDTKLFFNHGFYDEDMVAYDKNDIAWKNNINLYFHLLKIVGLNTDNISLLDVGLKM